ncbi:MAG TPA: hypothetical protein QF730_10640, partial [Planctomycetota bacterium]|nr:hypothetical protein [Planctomycetota bacterium]
VTSYCIAAPNTASATGAKIRMVGLPSISLNTSVLEATDCPAGQYGIFYYGPWQVQLPFGDGYRCVAGSVFRLMPPMLSSGAGVASRTLDYNASPMGSGAGQITSGSTWNFQYWYRDPTPVGYGFNLSDGLEVTFCP